MRKFIIGLASLSLLFLAPTVAARDKGNDNSQEQKIVTVPAGEVINKDYFATGDTVEISGTVNGDVYAFGGQVLVDGTVNGDLIAAGGLVNISGDISQDARVGGGQVTISGKIGRNLTVGGGNVDITSSATIAGGAVVGGGNVSLAAPVGKDAKIGAGNLTVSNTIAGDLDAGVGVMRLTSKAQIGGNLNYWSDQNASIDKNAKVVGKITKNKPAEAAKPSAKKVFGLFTGFNLIVGAISLISTLILGLLIIALFPRYNRAVVYTLKRRPWASLGVGFLALVLTPIIFVILLITVVAIPLAFVLLAFYAIALYLSRVFIIFWAGTMIFERTGRKIHEVWALIVGLIVYYILTLIPFIGGLVTFFVILFGLGTAILTKKEFYLAARKKDLL
ncbi:MAG: hypothetical protein A2126_02980 [Candidatus Woykebacteria bacterium GWB1_45_5]|uniref:DUF8173 domain-containing protein n=2 Tax=Candidatus Woykeibacteriota TaxID=1817899 RepID=A0A1G1W385_9BACT|nr:MAG: hypothetical protein A2113_00830 [Candidatus Woykebacteria bacterium GWA1_44_8]OGY22845.1 MAG: hypothetical protein A2126_02980 [Candidatus Woykebacteria bacterium GWB1_45_5]